MSRLPPRMRVDRTERAAATPETLAKRRPDILVEWHHGGIIGAEELAAGRQIRAMWAILSPIHNRGRGDPHGLAQSAITLREKSTYYDRLSARGDLVYTHVWQPWTRIQGKRLLAKLGYHTPLKVILDVVVDNEPCQHVDLVADGLAMWAKMMMDALRSPEKTRLGLDGIAVPAEDPAACCRA